MASIQRRQLRGCHTAGLTTAQAHLVKVQFVQRALRGAHKAACKDGGAVRQRHVSAAGVHDARNRISQRLGVEARNAHRNEVDKVCRQLAPSADAHVAPYATYLALDGKFLVPAEHPPFSHGKGREVLAHLVAVRQTFYAAEERLDKGFFHKVPLHLVVFAESIIPQARAHVPRHLAHKTERHHAHQAAAHLVVDFHLRRTAGCSRVHAGLAHHLLGLKVDSHRAPAGLTLTRQVAQRIMQLTLVRHRSVAERRDSHREKRAVFLQRRDKQVFGRLLRQVGHHRRILLGALLGLLLRVAIAKVAVAARAVDGMRTDTYHHGVKERIGRHTHARRQFHVLLPPHLPV